MRILVVEDDLAIAELVKEDLEAQGFAVDWAQDGDEAYSLSRSFPYDLLVLDIMLPGQNGFELTKKLRTEKAKVPVLMLTARDGIEDRVKGLELGADDYLVKPFHLTELRARVMALLRRSKGEADNSIQVGRLKLDISRRQVVWQGESISLSGREYALLEFFALHADGFYPREKLLEHVWPGEASIDPRTVDTYIRYLRRKLGDDAIETVRNIGYRFRG
ncbi:MAG: response regulator transcription factor [Trueperaceae bacterium]|nr:response regulator transcription factor [Trueperaceae bacterium]